jgi:hypothetical protein
MYICIYNMYNIAGQVVFAPMDLSADGECPTLFGSAKPGSAPPPYGSGTV